MNAVKVGKSMMMFNICVENKMKALKEGKPVVFDMEMSEIAEEWKHRDTSNNGIVLIDHVSKIK